MSHLRNNKKQSFNMFYHDEDLNVDSPNSKNNNDKNAIDNDDNDNELITHFSNPKVLNEFTKKKAIIHEKPSIMNKTKQINDKFISELSNRNNQGEYPHSKATEKKMENNLESKYGQGYKLLKQAGYKIGNGLGANEQGITDPIEIKIRKKKAGISQEDEYKNPLKEDKKNNFLLGRKRQGIEKAIDDTNEEMNNFERLIEAYTTNTKDNEELIENMLIKAKEYIKADKGKSLLLSKTNVYDLYSMPIHSNIISKYIGKEFNLNPILSKSKINNHHKEENNQLLIDLIDKTKSKVIHYLSVYYSNKNNRAILANLNETSQDDQIQIEDDYKQKQMFHSQLQNSSFTQITNGNITEYIQQYISLYNQYPKLFKNSYNKLCLICLKQTINFYQAQYNLITDFLDEKKARSFIFNSVLIKELIDKSYSDFDIGDINNDHMFSYNKTELNTLNSKANTYYSFFINEVLLRYMNDIIILQWNIKEYDKLSRFFQLYKNIIPQNLLDSISELISKKIIEFIINTVSFTPLKDDIFIHNWIHPLFDILSLKSIEAIEFVIQKKIMNDILSWNIEDESVSNKLISLLLPWRTVFAKSYWDELENKFFSPKLRFMFSLLKIQPSEQSIGPFIIMHQLLDSNMMNKEKCIPILKEEFFPKWIKTLNHWLKHGGISKEKLSEIQQWYRGWKELLAEQFNDSEVINSELKDGLILIYNYSKK